MQHSVTHSAPRKHVGRDCNRALYLFQYLEAQSRLERVPKLIPGIPRWLLLRRVVKPYCE